MQQELTNELEVKESNSNIQPEGAGTETPANSEPPIQVPETASSEPVESHKSLTFAEAVESIDHIDDGPAILPFEEGRRGGRGTPFVPNHDPDRKIDILSPLKGPAIIRYGRNSGDKNEGLFAAGWQLESQFPMRFHRNPHKTQLTMVLINGMQIVGYVFNTASRKGMYVPKKQLGDLELPPMGKTLPVKVAKLIIG